jgi:hypothetical protein
LENPKTVVCDDGTERPVTEAEADLRVKVWLLKNDYDNKLANYKDDLAKFKKDTKTVMSIVYARVTQSVVTSISEEFEGRDPAAVWASLVKLGESEVATTLLDLHSTRAIINLKATGTIRKMQAKFEELDKLIVSAGDRAPSEALTISTLRTELQKYSAFDTAVAIKRAANCTVLSEWWAELKKVEQDQNNKGVPVLKTLKKAAAGEVSKGWSRAHNVREVGEEGENLPAFAWQGVQGVPSASNKAYACRICNDDSHKAEACDSNDAVTCPDCKWKVHKLSTECSNFRCPSRGTRGPNNKPKSKSKANLTSEGKGRRAGGGKAQEEPDLSELMSMMKGGFERVNLSMKKMNAKVKKVSSKVKKVDRELNGSEDDEDSDESG